MNRESNTHESHHHQHPQGFGPFGPFGPARGRGGFGPRGFGPGMGAGFGAGFGPMGFGPGGPRGFGGPGSQRRPKGAARDAILSILADGPQNGYGLIKEITERSGDTWVPSPGSVYPTLQQLVDEGLIEPTSDDKRTEFKLTDAGSAYVAEHAEQFAQLWQGASEHTEANAGLHEAIGQLMGAVHQFRFQASESQRTQAVALLEETRKALYRILAE